MSDSKEIDRLNRSLQEEIANLILVCDNCGVLNYPVYDVDTSNVLYAILTELLDGISDYDVEMVSHGGYRLTLNGTTYDREPLIRIARRLEMLLQVRDDLKKVVD